MKKIVPVVLLLVFLSCSAFAQGSDLSQEGAKSQATIADNQTTALNQSQSEKPKDRVTRSQWRKEKRERRRADRRIRRDRLQNQLSFMYYPIE